MAVGTIARAIDALKTCALGCEGVSDAVVTVSATYPRPQLLCQLTANCSDSQSSEIDAWGKRHVDSWTSVFDEMYQGRSDLTGQDEFVPWISSYTGRALPLTD